MAVFAFPLDDAQIHEYSSDNPQVPDARDLTVSANPDPGETLDPGQVWIHSFYYATITIKRINSPWIVTE